MLIFGFCPPLLPEIVIFFRKRELPQSKPDGFASSLGEGAYPFRLAASRQATFPKGTAFGGGDKVSGIAIRRPLGGAGFAQQRLRGYSPQRRAFAESGAANAVCRYDPSRENSVGSAPQSATNAKL